MGGSIDIPYQFFIDVALLSGRFLPLCLLFSVCNKTKAHVNLSTICWTQKIYAEYYNAKLDIYTLQDRLDGTIRDRHGKISKTEAIRKKRTHEVSPNKLYYIH